MLVILTTMIAKNFENDTIFLAHHYEKDFSQENRFEWDKQQIKSCLINKK